MTFQELLIFIGIILFMGVVKLPDRSMYFDLEEQGPLIEFRIGQFMTKSRFDAISACLTLRSPPSPAQLKENPFYEVDMMINSFSVARCDFITPGRMVVVGECMSPWLGDQQWNLKRGHRHPHVQTMDRKSIPIGTELKAIADCSSGIMLALEIVQATDHMKAKEFVSKYDSSEVGYLLRLTRAAALWGSGRVVLADSAFASVRACYALKTEANLGFIGLVKTDTALFPEEIMKKDAVPLGTSTILSTSVKVPGTDTPLEIAAVIWQSKQRKYFVSTTGSANPAAKPHIRHRKVFNSNGELISQSVVEVPRTDIVRMYMENANRVDIHNQLRSNGRTDYSFPTWSWTEKLFISILGMVGVDVAKCVALDLSTGGYYEDMDKKNLAHIQLLKRLSTELITNTVRLAAEAPFPTPGSKRKAI